MSDKKQNNPFFTVLFIALGTFSMGTIAYKYSENKKYEAQAKQRMKNIKGQERLRAELKIEDKLFISKEAPTTIQEPSTSTVSPETVETAEVKPITLSPFINFIGHIHTGIDIYLVGPPPSTSSDGKLLAMFTKSDPQKESGQLTLTVSDIEYVPDRKFHDNDSLDRVELAALHETNSTSIKDGYVHNIVELTHLDNDNWFWLIGNYHVREFHKRGKKKVSRTCWFTWSGQHSEKPNKTCLDPNLESRELFNFQVSRDGSVGLFTQRNKIRDAKTKYGDIIPFMSYRIIAVDLKTGDLISESPVTHSTEKDYELGAYFLESQSAKAIVYESLKPVLDRSQKRSIRQAKLDLHVWDITANKIIGETQTLLTTTLTEYPTNIHDALAVPKDQSLQLLYENGRSQIIVDSKSGLVKNHITKEQYNIYKSTDRRGRAQSGFPLANGNMLFDVTGKYLDDSWRVYNQESKNILGQQVDKRGLELSYPYGQFATQRMPGGFEVYKIQE